MTTTIIATINTLYPPPKRPSPAAILLTDEILEPFPAMMPPTAVAFGIEPESAVYWRNYCRARVSFLIYPWLPGQERCITELLRFLSSVSISQSSRTYIAGQVNKSLQAIRIKAVAA